MPESELRRDADVIFDGIALSEPTNIAIGGTTDRALASPARFEVLRYLKGRGPDFVRVKTEELQVIPGSWSDLVSVLAGQDAFTAGDTWRIYGGPSMGRRGTVSFPTGRAAARIHVALERGCGESIEAWYSRRVLRGKRGTRGC